MTINHLNSISVSLKADEAIGHLEDGGSQLLGVKLDAQEAVANFNQACELVRIYGNDVDLKVEDLTFESLKGNMVGEARVDGVYLDPEILRYSPIIQAKIIYHELRHCNKDMMHEGITEGGAELKFGKDDVSHPYVEQVANYLKFAAMFDEGNSAEAGDSKIFGLYKARNIESIYVGYKKNHMDALESDAEKDEAFDFFTEVFPELRYGGNKPKPGDFDLKDVETKSPKETKPVLSVAEKVNERLEDVQAA
jgi:hypothetical protein